MEVVPYGFYNHPHESQHDQHHQYHHQFPNSHSYPYGYPGEDSEPEPKKGSSFSGLKSVISWKKTGDSDAEAQRKRRVAAYKRFNSRRRVGESVKWSVRWFRVKCYRVVYRWW